MFKQRGDKMTGLRTTYLAVAWMVVAPALCVAGDPAANSPGKSPGDSPGEAPSYYRDIRPIFQEHCQGCHQPAKAGGKFVITSHASILGSDKDIVVPGKPGRPNEKNYPYPRRCRRGFYNNGGWYRTPGN